MVSGVAGIAAGIYTSGAYLYGYPVGAVNGASVNSWLFRFIRHGI
jgi:hypothetical protein